MTKMGILHGKCSEMWSFQTPRQKSGAGKKIVIKDSFIT